MQDIDWEALRPFITEVENYMRAVPADRYSEHALMIERRLGRVVTQIADNIFDRRLVTGDLEPVV